MSAILTQIEGLPAVAAETAAELGTVKTLKFDRTGRSITGIEISDGLLKSHKVRWSAVSAIGPDAVILSVPESEEPLADESLVWSQDREDESEIDFVGSSVLTTDGLLVGTVNDVHLDAETGSVNALMTTNGRIGGERIRSLGTFAAVVVPD